MSGAGADLAFLGARRLAALVRERTVSPVELTQLYLARIDRLDPRLHAYITVLPDAALATARRAEAAVMRGAALGPLHGVPYAVKDQFDTAGVRTTSGVLPRSSAMFPAKKRRRCASLVPIIVSSNFASGSRPPSGCG